MVLSISMAGATPKLTRSASESRSPPMGEKRLSARAEAPSRKSKTAAMPMAVMHHCAPSRGPYCAVRLKAMNMATQHERRLSDVIVLGINPLKSDILCIGMQTCHLGDATDGAVAYVY